VDANGTVDYIDAGRHTLEIFKNIGTATVPIFTEITGAANPLSGTTGIGYNDSVAVAGLDAGGNPEILASTGGT